MQQFIVSDMDDTQSPVYDPDAYPRFAVTVDVALFTIREGNLHVLLVERGEEPFIGHWALPGGFVRIDEDLSQAATRELVEETAVHGGSWHLEQLGSYGSPSRDPRMRVVTVAHWGICSELPDPKGGGDAATAELKPIEGIERGAIRLAFDHGQIMEDALERMRSKLEYTALAARFCKPRFTITELREVYEAVWNTRLDPGNFQRGFRENACFVRCGEAPVGLTSRRGRPASLWSVHGAARQDQSLALLDRTLARR